MSVCTGMCMCLCMAFLSGCQSDSEGEVDDDGGDPVVEWMKHDKDGLTVERTARIGSDGMVFELAGTRFEILERWPHAEAQHENLDDNPEESHAVEMAWGPSEEGEQQSDWIYQASGSDGTVVLPGTELQVRVMPAGALPGWKDLWEENPRRTVQFAAAGKFYSLPPDDGEVFPGWKVRSVRYYQHALLDDSGAVEESEDAGFTNRAVEVVLASVDETTVERHLAFPDHPEITKGIHPALLPVSRLSGEGASQSRLVVCDALDRPGASNALVLCPSSSNSDQLTAFSWDQESKAMSESKNETLPAELELANGKSVRILRHRTHARSVVKWRRCEEADEGEALPALVIGWAESGVGHKQTVLIHNRSTPFRLRGEFQTFRFRR